MISISTIFSLVFAVTVYIMRIVAFICQILFLTTVAMGQSPEVIRNQIDFEIGPHFGYLRDLNYSPLNYRESGLLLSLAYAHRSKRDNVLFTTDIDFTPGKLRTDASDFFTTEFLQANIEMSVLFKLLPKEPGRFSLFAGPQYNSFIHYMDWGAEFDSWTYFMVHGLYVKVLGEYKLTQRARLQTSLSVPVFSNLVRPPYNGFDQYVVDHSEQIVQLSFKGESASFDKFVGVDWKTTYRYEPFTRLGFVFTYLARYQWVPGENSVKHFQNQLSTGMTFRW